MVVSVSTNQVWTKITIRSYAHVFCHSEPDRSSVWAMHWICALKSWFLLHFSFIFVYVSSWNDIIKSQGKNLRSSDRRNYFHHISSDTSTCSNYFAFTLRNRYVVKEKFVQPLKIILKLKMSFVVRGSRLKQFMK